MTRDKRPKRQIQKPKKYQTTSSEDEPPAKRNRAKAAAEVVESDYDAMLRRMATRSLEESEAEVHSRHPPNPPLPLSSTFINAPPSPCVVSPLSFPAHCPSSPSRATEQCNPPTTTAHPSLSLSPPTLATNVETLKCVQQTLRETRMSLQNQEMILQCLGGIKKHLEKLEERAQTQLLQGQAAISEEFAEGGIEQPHFLPLRSVEEVEHFKTCPAEDYERAVQYFVKLRGLTLKEALTYCFKMALVDETAASYTWLCANNSRPLHSRRIMLAIYASIARSCFFQQPTGKEFAAHIKRALKTAKQRHRSKNVLTRASSSAATPDATLPSSSPPHPPPHPPVAPQEFLQ